MKYTRRDFVQTAAAAGAAAGLSTFSDLPSLAAAPAESSRMETLREWLRADRATRRRGLELCQQRIRQLDPSIHAWVQVQPERPTADGPLSEIPFGAKDIIETQGMATEYGSPVYRGRLGFADAAIIRTAQPRAILLGKTVTTAFAYRTQVQRGIRVTWSTHLVEARAVLQQRWLRAWCPSRSVNRQGGP